MVSQTYELENRRTYHCTVMQKVSIGGDVKIHRRLQGQNNLSPTESVKHFAPFTELCTFIKNKHVFPCRVSP